MSDISASYFDIRIQSPKNEEARGNTRSPSTGPYILQIESNK